MDEKTRRIWVGLVSYANGTATPAEIKATIVDCMRWVTATMPADVFDLAFTMEEDLPKQAEAYRPAIKMVLRFLCSEPKSEERTSLRVQALSFLSEHGEHIRGQLFREASYSLENLRNLNYTSDELENFKEQIKAVFDQAQYEKYHRGQPTLVGENSLPFGLLIPSKGYQDFVDPICDFLSSEYQKYLNRDVSRKDKGAGPLVPIFVCPSCKKLVMPKRVGRRHYCPECSDRARAEKYRQNASPDEGRDYAWLYHLLDQESGARKTRLRQPKVQQRLGEIKSRQKNSPRCQGLLQALHL
jgi:predicted RNA-binding Zn-ribbon protein involved in translation (DUF1610 family)